MTDRADMAYRAGVQARKSELPPNACPYLTAGEGSVGRRLVMPWMQGYFDQEQGVAAEIPVSDHVNAEDATLGDHVRAAFDRHADTVSKKPPVATVPDLVGRLLDSRKQREKEGRAWHTVRRALERADRIEMQEERNLSVAIAGRLGLPPPGAEQAKLHVVELPGGKRVTVRNGFGDELEIVEVEVHEV